MMKNRSLLYLLLLYTVAIAGRVVFRKKAKELNKQLFFLL